MTTEASEQTRVSDGLPPSPRAPWRVRAWTARNRFGLALFGAAWLVLLFWWAAYRPGLFSPDSLAYISQVTTGGWDTHHSVTYDALVWLSLYGTGGVGALTLAQTLTMAAGLAYAATHLRRLGVAGWLLGVAGVALVALPSVGSFTVCVWKDVPYTVASLFAVGTVARLTGLRLARTPVPTTLWLVLGGELVVVGLMRPNGFVVAALAGAGLAAALPGLRLRAIAVAAAAAALTLVATFVVFPALGVRNVFGEASSGPTYGDLAVLYAEHPDDFSAPDRALLASVAPLEVWRGSATCVSSDATIFAPGFDAAAAEAHRAALTSLWSRLARQEPATVLAARLCRGSVAWKPAEFSRADHLTGTPVNGFAAFLTPAFRATPYASAVRSDPLSDRAHEAAVALNKLVAGPVADAVLWRGSFWSYASYVALIVAAVRRRSRLLLALGVLTLANQVVVLAQTPVPAARYMFAPLVAGPLLSCVAFLRARPEAEPVEVLSE